MNHAGHRFLSQAMTVIGCLFFCLQALLPGFTQAQTVPLGARPLTAAAQETQGSAATQGDASLIASLAGNAKLLNAPAILEPLQQGKPATAVIVTLRPTTAAAALAAQSQQAAVIPDGLNQPGAPVFYDLSDQGIRAQLRSTVEAKVDQVIRQLAGPGLAITHRFSYQFGFAAQATPAALEQILANPEVIRVEQDGVLQAHLGQGIPLMKASIPRGTYTGSGLSIAICDTGIDTSHPRLGNGGSLIFNSKVIGGYDFGDNDADPRPNGNAHGTACAGIAAGDLGTTGDYIGGVAPAAKLYAIKISTGTSGSSNSSIMMAGWEWAITHQNDAPANPIMIISTSFGGGYNTSTCDSDVPAMTTAAANAVAAGITIFVSSGNDGYCNGMGWPACISHVNSVGAVYDANISIVGFCVSVSSCALNQQSHPACPTNYNAVFESTAADKVTVYSNSASFLTLFAPSHNAYTTDIVGSGGYSTGDYINTFGGTSAACPYAAGAAAVLQSAAKAKTGSFLTPAKVKQYLTEQGDLITDGKVAITKPRINLDKAVNTVCGASIPLTAGLWQMLSLPCVPDASPASVANVFGNSPTANLDDLLYDVPSSGWAMYRRIVNTTPSSYEKLLINGTLATGAGYWIKSLSAPVNNRLAVAGTTTPAPVTTSDGCASANGCVAVPVSTVGGDNRYNLVGNPFPYAVDWAKVRVRVKNGASLVGVYTPSQAAGVATSGNATPPVLSNQIWIWNDTNTGYDTWSDTSVPNPGNLKYFKSFWVNVLSGAAELTVELLIPAEITTHGQVKPAAMDEPVAATGQPWSLAWLDWLIPSAAAAQDDLTPPRRDTDETGRPSPRPGQAVMDPTFEDLVIEYEQRGLSPQEAGQEARAQMRREEREWYVLLKVDNPTTGWKTHNSVLGQLLTAKEDYDPADLVAMAPFATPYLTLVFPHPEWGDRKGDYASDFRPASGLKPSGWNFELRAEPVGSQVILSWEGNPDVLKRSRLIDRDTGATIEPNDRRYAKGYPVTLTGKVRRFAWYYLVR